MNKKIFLIFIVGMLMVNLVCALEVLPGGQVNKEYIIKQTCATCTYVNISVSTINGFVLNNVAMTNNGSGTWIYTYTPTSPQRYDVLGSGDLDGTATSFATYFMVSNTGNEINDAQAFLYILVEIILGVLLFLGIYGGLNVSFKNIRNHEGEVVQVNWRKYLNIFCWGMSYTIALAMVFIAWNLVYAYSQWQTLGVFLRYIFTLMHVLGYVIFVCIMILGIVNYVSDKKIESFIKKSGLPYG